MKYYILNVFRTSTAFKEKSSVILKIFINKLLTNFEVNMASFLEGAPNYVLNL